MSTELDQKINLLKSKIDGSIADFNKRRTNNKFKARNLHMSTTVLAAVSTIILGLDLSGVLKLHSAESLTKNIALIISAFITIFSAYNTFFDHRSLWVSYTSTRNKLYKLQFDLGYYLEGNENPKREDIDIYANQYQAIIDDVNQSWVDLRN